MTACGELSSEGLIGHLVLLLAGRLATAHKIACIGQYMYRVDVIALFSFKQKTTVYLRQY